MLLNIMVFLTTLSTCTDAIPLSIDRRGFFDSITNDLKSPFSPYAPSFGKCPGTPLLRRSTPQNPLSHEETAYIANKIRKSQPAWRAYLTNVNLPGLNIDDFVSRAGVGNVGALPNIGFAVSGGGQRAMLVGLGILNGFDGRLSQALERGTGGVQQLVNYMSGLSGGSWFITSWALGDYEPLVALMKENWSLDVSMASTKRGTVKFAADIVANLPLKRLSTFEISSVDIWGRSISAMVLANANPSSIYGPGADTLYSSITSLPSFLNHQMPFPIVIALSREGDKIHVDHNSLVYEFTPYEFGTWDRTIQSAFIPIKYLGTSLKNGIPQTFRLDKLVFALSFHLHACVTGLDNAGFIMGTSGNALGTPAQLFFDKVLHVALSSPVIAAIGQVFNQLLHTSFLSAVIPNPFQGLNPGTFKSTSDTNLNLVDGGLAHENIPFTPLFQSERQLDVIIAVDASANHDHFPSGKSPRTTYLKSLQPEYKGVAFPFFPDPVTFLRQGLHQRPSFCGSACTGVVPLTPLIIYLPNYHIHFNTNTATIPRTYSSAEQDGFIKNGWSIATQDHVISTTEEGNVEWSKCLACALIDPQLARNQVTRLDYCERCFVKYCYMETADVA